jgi:hypothetical protein
MKSSNIGRSGERVEVEAGERMRTKKRGIRMIKHVETINYKLAVMCTVVVVVVELVVR